MVCFVAGTLLGFKFYITETNDLNLTLYRPSFKHDRKIDMYDPKTKMMKPWVQLYPLIISWFPVITWSPVITTTGVQLVTVFQIFFSYLYTICKH